MSHAAADKDSGGGAAPQSDLHRFLISQSGAEIRPGRFLVSEAVLLYAFAAVNYPDEIIADRMADLERGHQRECPEKTKQRIFTYFYKYVERCSAKIDLKRPIVVIDDVAPAAQLVFRLAEDQMKMESSDVAAWRCLTDLVRRGATLIPPSFPYPEPNESERDALKSHYFGPLYIAEYQRLLSDETDPIAKKVKDDMDAGFKIVLELTRMKGGENIRLDLDLQRLIGYQGAPDESIFYWDLVDGIAPPVSAHDDITGRVHYARAAYKHAERYCLSKSDDASVAILRGCRSAADRFGHQALAEAVQTRTVCRQVLEQKK